MTSLPSPWPPPNPHRRSSNESISNKVGNATGGAVGDETILHQATNLASHSVEYAKSVVGLGGHKAAESVEDATENKQGGVTLGGLVNESRDLAANVLHTVQGERRRGEFLTQSDASYSRVAGMFLMIRSPVLTHYSPLSLSLRSVVAGGAQQAKETAQEGADQAEPQAKGVVQKVREVAASAIGAAENIIATGAKKVEEGADELSNSSTQDLKNKASDAYDSAAKSASNIADDLSKKTDSAASDVSKKVDEKIK
ncbi:BQ2448_3488 [Microbotryum intermedium]|uniref:BQ2448_3488 protein n=1 Tax=Microbotryum intermedium TaxID=269621 RepID=A0A238FI28_9BASI|nr:BQ2448_3488 [Microbotryum intermedium]